MPGLPFIPNLNFEQVHLHEQSQNLFTQAWIAPPISIPHSPLNSAPLVAVLDIVMSTLLNLVHEQ